MTRVCGAQSTEDAFRGWVVRGSVGVFMAVFPAVEGYVAGSKGLAHELVVSVRCKRRASHTWLRNAEGFHVFRQAGYATRTAVQ